MAIKKIDLSAVSEITSFADLSNNHLSEVNGSAVITDGADTITIKNVGQGLLTSDDFTF